MTLPDNWMANLKLDHHLKIKGLPFKVSIDDVYNFFSSYDITKESIFLKRNIDGKLNGEGYVQFQSSKDAEHARSEKNRKQFNEKFGERFVMLFVVTTSDYEDLVNAIQQKNYQGQALNAQDCVIKLKYLPVGTTQMDIIKYFDEFKLKPNGVQIVVRQDNTPTQEAFVDLISSEEATRALEAKSNRQPFNSEKFGDRYIQPIQVSIKEMQTSLALRFGGEGILKIKGIPFHATSKDIRLFLKGFQIQDGGISFIMRDDGSSSGMAFIEFESSQEALKCLDMKHRKPFGPKFGNRFCQLEPVGRLQMERARLAKEQTSSQLQDDLNRVQAAKLLASVATLSQQNSGALNDGMGPQISPDMQNYFLQLCGQDLRYKLLQQQQIQQPLPLAADHMKDITSQSLLGCRDSSLNRSYESLFPNISQYIQQEEQLSPSINCLQQNFAQGQLNQQRFSADSLDSLGQTIGYQAIANKNIVQQLNNPFNNNILFDADVRNHSRQNSSHMSNSSLGSSLGLEEGYSSARSGSSQSQLDNSYLFQSTIDNQFLQRVL